MKHLWKHVPPCMSDVLGFEAVLNNTEGLGVIDDCGQYKPIGMGRGGEFGRGGPGRPGGPGGRGGRGRPGWDIRVVNSEIRNADVITGTERKVLDAFAEGAARRHPNFVLLCHAPSSSMIGSDLEANAARIAEESGLPAAYARLDGSRDYLYGVSVTLEAMGKLLLQKTETRPGTVNLLGCDPIGWAEDTLPSVEAWLGENGLRVLSRWGGKETTETLRAAAGAERNLVVSAAGLRLARYMEAEYGIPYTVGAPFGKAQCARLLQNGPPAETDAAAGEEPSVLIVGEYLTADAIRWALEERGVAGIRCLTFFDADKSLLRPGDEKLAGEDALCAQLAQPSVERVFCDPDCKPLLRREGVTWVNLTNAARHAVAENVPPADFVREKLDAWLDEVTE